MEDIKDLEPANKIVSEDNIVAPAPVINEDMIKVKCEEIDCSIVCTEKEEISDVRSSEFQEKSENGIIPFSCFTLLHQI